MQQGLLGYENHPQCYQRNRLFEDEVAVRKWFKKQCKSSSEEHLTPFSFNTSDRAQFWKMMLFLVRSCHFLLLLQAGKSKKQMIKSRTGHSLESLQEVLLCTPVGLSPRGTAAAQAIKEVDPSYCPARGANSSQMLCLAAALWETPSDEPRRLRLQPPAGRFDGHPGGNGLPSSSHVLNQAGGKTLPDFKADMSSA